MSELPLKQEVTQETVTKAFQTWFDFQNSTYGNSIRSFYAFTGIRSFMQAKYIVTQEQERRINLMAGPNGRTLLAAHFASEETP